MGENILTTDQIFDSENIAPERIVIIGGGAIGIEFASFLADLHCDVTVIESQDRILGGMSADMAQAIHRHLTRKCIKIFTASKVESLSDEDGEVYVSTRKKNGEIDEFLVDKALIATGREANIDEAFLKFYGVNRENGLIKTDKNLMTTNENIYAAGDVSNPIQLAYLAGAEGEAVADAIVGKTRMDVGAVPKCVFMDTEAVSAGESEDTLKAKGVKYEIGEISLKMNSMAYLQGKTEGYCKLISDERKEKLLGVEIFSNHAVDMIELCKYYIDNGENIENIANKIFPHPSYIEMIRTAAQKLMDR